jgi:hypothetical protein
MESESWTRNIVSATAEDGILLDFLSQNIDKLLKEEFCSVYLDWYIKIKLLLPKQ